MSNNIRLIQGNPLRVPVPVANATAVEIGDMLKLDTNLGVVCTAATDNLTLHAVALQAHAADSGAKSILCARAIKGTLFEFPLNAETSVAYGDELQISGAQELTKSDTDSVALARETNTTATKILCEFKDSVVDAGDLT